MRDPGALAREVAAGIRKAGRRGIIGSGWGGLSAEEAADMHVVGSVPHGWLFGRVAAVIHHGGAGSTAAGFCAGVPSIICPFAFDQPYWAEFSRDLGVGVEPLPVGELTADRLADRIRTAVTDEEIKRRARTMGERLRAEDGVGTAVGFIETLLAK